MVAVWKCFCKFTLSGNPSVAVVGEKINLTLTCTTDDNYNYVKWSEQSNINGFVPIAEMKPICVLEISVSRDGYVYTCNITSKEYFLTIPIQYVDESLVDIKWVCASVNPPPSDPWNLEIAVPVTTVTLTPSGNNNVVNVVVGDAQTFNCSTGLSRPAAWIQWYIGGENVTDQAQPQTPQPDGDKFISSSRFEYTGKDEDHNKHIYCEAVNIEGREKVKSSKIAIYVELPVTTVTLTPSGNNNVVNVVVGDTQTFNCSTGLSRPAAWILWYIGGENMTDQAQPQTPQPNGDKFISSSTLEYTGKDKDHKTNIYCKAINIEGRNEIQSTEISIDIQIPVTIVAITPAGNNNVVKVVLGDTQTFNCSTGSSRPAAWIQWYIGGENITDQAQPQTPQRNGDKLISSSRLVYTGKDEDHNKHIYCEAVNIEGRDKVKSTEILIYIQIPLNSVTIAPADDVISVIEGDIQSFKCTTNSCRPAAWIQWYIGGENVTDQANPQTPQPDGNNFISSSRLEYTGKDGDHNKHIYCEAVNIEGRDKVKSTNKSFFIFVPVKTVTITPDGNNGSTTKIVENLNQTFNCTTDSSRPAATIQWYIGKQNVTDKAHFQVSPSNGTKYRSSSSLVYTGKDSDHNKIVYCEVINIIGRDNVKSKIYSLYIQFGPKNITLYPSEVYFTITETKSLEINCSATCRPDCNFTWSGPDIYTRHQHNLHLASVFRNQSGLYSCNASNSLGSKISTYINITVNYPPNIVQLRSSNGNYIKENTSVTLNCEIDSHPVSDVSWIFTKINSFLNTSLNAQQSNYTIQTADCFRTGTYQCLAQNSIDNSVMTDNKSIDMYVNCSPRSDARKHMEDSIIGIDDNGILNITVYLIAYPQPNITWTFENTETRQNVSVASNNTFSTISHISTIQDLQIDKADYGIYTIHASNNIGDGYIRSFKIIPQRKPDPPTNLSVECDITAMTVTWRSEFDGGDAQVFNVQWLNLNTNTTITSNAIQNKGEGVYHIFTTELLLPSSLYIVMIEARNTHDAVISEEVNCTTNALPKKGKSESTTIGIIGGILGFVCALLVVTGMLIFLRRRRRQKEDKEPIKGSKDTEIEQDDDDGLKENPLYVTSGQTRDNDNGPLYSEVKKPRKGQPLEIKDENAIYSQVEKTVKKGKQKKKEKNTGKEREKGIQDKAIELGSVYENSEKLMNTQSHEEYANTSGDVATNGQGYKVTRNKDGLIYADLDLKPDQSGRRFVIRGIENRNDYAILDLTKTAEPLPSDDSDDEKHISVLTDDTK